MQSRLAVLILACFACAIFAGCPSKPAPAPMPKEAAPAAALRLIIVDDPALGAALKRHWLAHTESELQVRDITAEQAVKAKQLPADVVIYPPALLGQLATAELLSPLDENLLAEPDYARGELLPRLLDTECSWGKRIMAAPLGSPQLVLFYRADLIEAAKVALPNTWEEYASLVERFANSPDGAASWQPTAEPLADGWASRLLLARAAAGAQHRDQLSSLWKVTGMEPRIADPPWVRALEQLTTVQAKAKNDKLLSPQECLAKFLAGECAFANSWPQTLPADSSVKLKPEQIGQWRLPGSTEAFNPETAAWEPIRDGGSLSVPALALSGRVASIARASSQPQAAARFLLWLSGPSVSGRVAPESAATTVFRSTHFRSDGTWQANADLKPLWPAYGELLANTEGQFRQLVAPRIPGEHQYMSALDEAVLSAVQDQTPAEEALQKAATRWREITDEHGAANQQRALRQSLRLSE